MSTTDVGASGKTTTDRENDIRSERRSSASHRHMVWGATGFVLGVVVWHFVGFWSLVSTILYRGPEPTVLSAEDQRERAALMAARQSWTKPAAAPPSLTTGSIARAPTAACVALVLDRAAQSTSLAECAPDAIPQATVARHDGHATTAALRADRLATAISDSNRTDSGDWSVLVDASRLERQIETQITVTD
jgi:hypothetical protein